MAEYIDGIRLQTGDRILFRNNGPRWVRGRRVAYLKWLLRGRSMPENGIYVVTGTSDG